MPALSTELRETLTDMLSLWRDGQARIGATVTQLAWQLQPAAIAVLRAGDGRNASGLFSEFASVVGLLDEYERRRDRFAGLRVSFDAGLYFDPAAGANWWTYYFEPIEIGSQSRPQRVISQPLHDLYANRVERSMTRSRAGELVARHVRLQPVVQRCVDTYLRAHWTPSVIGVHYRGTDKFVDAPRVEYADIAALVRKQLSSSGSDARVFVATDEAPFVDYMRDCFPDRVLVREVFRSRDGRPIDVVNADANHQKGLDAVVDCVLLSKSNFLIRTASNLGLVSTFFNPQLPCVLLNPER